MAGDTHAPTKLAATGSNTSCSRWLRASILRPRSRLYTLVMASLMITGGKIGQILGPQARVRHRLHHLRCGIVRHLHRPESCGAAVRLVIPGRHGRRARCIPADRRRG